MHVTQGTYANQDPTALIVPTIRGLAEEDVLVSPWSATRIRMVVHLDAPAPACERAGELLGGILARLAA